MFNKIALKRFPLKHVYCGELYLPCGLVYETGVSL